MNVLVTGGSGFIGRNIVEKLLKSRNEVTILDNSPNEMPAATIKADIRNMEETSRLLEGSFDAMIHLAAKSDARNMQDFRLFKEINIDGTMNILEIARKKDIKTVIFPSSSHVYGDMKERSFREDAAIKPVSYYGTSKFFGETVCKAYSDFYGINCVVLRLFTVYGPRGRPDMAVMKFIQSIDKGEPLQVHGNGTIKKDFVYVDDVSSAMINAMNSNIKYQIINIGSGKATPLSGVIALIEKQLGKKARKEPVKMQPGDSAYSCADIRKARKLLKWKPEISIKEGISRTAAWWKASANY